jgi:predicted ATPase with chaperone activity
MTHRPNLISQCVSIEKAEYEIVRNSILKNLFAYGAMTSEQLALLVKHHLQSKTDDGLWQHYWFVKQELETHGEIRSVPNTHPELIELNV